MRTVCGLLLVAVLALGGVIYYTYELKLRPPVEKVIYQDSPSKPFVLPPLNKQPPEVSKPDTPPEITPPRHTITPPKWVDPIKLKR